MAALPNIVLVTCDQLRAFDTGCYGHPVVKTPHIDALAAAGRRFELGITNAPVCTPGRSCMLSGQHARTCNGTQRNAPLDSVLEEDRVRLPETLLPEALKAAGYDTALIGKWHLFPHPMLCGFDEAAFCATAHRHYGQVYFRNREPGFVVDSFGPEWEMDEVDRYLDRRGGDPFFLFYNIGPPHMPIGPGNAPDRYFDLYDPAGLPLRANVPDPMPHNEWWFKVYTRWDYYYRNYELQTDAMPPGFDLRALTAWYDGMVNVVDDLLGRLMASLRRRGLAGNTLVLFTSDHGDNLGSHGRFNKDSTNEEAIRVPFIAAGPGVAPGVNRLQTAQLIDIMPTLLAMAGLPVPGYVHGRDLSPVLRGEREELPENGAVVECASGAIAWRTPTHLLTLRADRETHELGDEIVEFFDLESDPYQRRNLAAAAADDPVARELAARIRDWHAATPWLELPASHRHFGERYLRRWEG